MILVMKNNEKLEERVITLDEFNVIKKEDNELKAHQIKKHLCTNCANACSNKCMKVKDIDKKNIKEYSDIKRGYQVIDDNGSMKKFVVEDCNNYLEEKKVSKKELEKVLLKNVKQLVKSYYGTETIEDAKKLEQELIERGTTISPDKKKHKRF